jgi:ubiquitin C-terminal hydrolase
MVVAMTEGSAKGGKATSDAREAFEAGTADDKQLAMVEAMMEGSAKGVKTISDAREAFEAGTADDAQHAMVVAMTEGSAKGGKATSDAREAFEAGTADDAQHAMVVAMTEGSAKGGKAISDAREAARAMVEAMTEGLATSRKTVSDAWEAFKAGKADDAQRAIVEAQMEGSKTVSDAWEAFKAGKADDAQRAIVEAMMEGPRTVWDALEAVRYDFENGTTTATEEQFDIAQRVFAPKMMRRGENPAEIIIWRNKDAALAALEPGTGVSVPTRVPGFKNRGNTCFLAATAQVLCGLSAFAGDLVALPDASSPGALGFGSAFEGAAGADARGAPSPGSRGGVASALRALVHAREDHASLFDNPQTRALATASLDPSQLKEAIQSWHEQYKGYEQHDAHEFLGHTFEALSQEVAGNGVSSARSPTCRFEGAFTTTFRCEECETYACSSTEPEWFRWLSLDLPDSDTGSAEPLELEGLIARYFAPEIVEKLCERDGCGGTHAEMARQLTCAPEALFVHLKRYRAEREGLNLRYVKDSREVELPMTVTLAPHDGVSAAADPDSPADEAAASTRVCAEDDSVAGEAARSQLASYRLAGVVSHFGEATNGGHYVASARVDVGGETTAKCWMSFNDEEVCYVESPAYAESTPEDWYLAVFEYAPDSDETVADAASEPDAFQFGKISEACKYLLEDAGPDGLSVATLTQQIQEGNLAQLGGKKPNNSVAERLRLNALFEKVAHGVYRLADGVGAAVQGECASEPDAFKFGTIGNACMNLLKNAGADGLSTSTLAQEINELELAKLSGRTTKKNVARSLGKDRRFVRVAPGVFALKDSSPHLFSARAAQDWVQEVQEAYLGDGNGDFVPGDGEDDVEFLTESASLAPLKASDGYEVRFRVSSMRAAMSPPGSLYSDVYNCLQNECKFSTYRDTIFVRLPVGARTGGVSMKVATFLKSFLYKVRKLTDADVNAINAAADAAATEKKKKAKEAKKAKKRAR